ncbi:hypothetical protein DFJ73DRAFT_800489, partial [Zopfochytrium polystomum]
RKLNPNQTKQQQRWRCSDKDRSPPPQKPIRSRSQRPSRGSWATRGTPRSCSTEESLLSPWRCLESSERTCSTSEGARRPPVLSAPLSLHSQGAIVSHQINAVFLYTPHF